MDNTTVPIIPAQAKSSSGNHNDFHLLALIVKHKAWKNGQLQELATRVLAGSSIDRERDTDVTVKEWDKIIQSSTRR